MQASVYNCPFTGRPSRSMILLPAVHISIDDVTMYHPVDSGAALEAPNRQTWLVQACPYPSSRYPSHLPQPQRQQHNNNTRLFFFYKSSGPRLRVQLFFYYHSSCHLARNVGPTIHPLPLPKISWPRIDPGAAKITPCGLNDTPCPFQPGYYGTTIMHTHSLSSLAFPIRSPLS